MCVFLISRNKGHFSAPLSCYNTVSLVVYQVYLCVSVTPVIPLFGQLIICLPITCGQMRCKHCGEDLQCRQGKSIVYCFQCGRNPEVGGGLAVPFGETLKISNFIVVTLTHIEACGASGTERYYLLHVL